MTDDEAKRHEDLIEALLAEYDWKISRDEAARIAARLVETMKRR